MIHTNKLNKYLTYIDDHTKRTRDDTLGTDLISHDTQWLICHRMAGNLTFYFEIVYVYTHIHTQVLVQKKSHRELEMGNYLDGIYVWRQGMETKDTNTMIVDWMEEIRQVMGHSGI